VELQRRSRREKIAKGRMCEGKKNTEERRVGVNISLALEVYEKEKNVQVCWFDPD